MTDNTSVYSAAFRRLRRFYPGGSTYYAHQRLLERTQWLSPEELAAWQLLGLQGIVKHAYENVPFYRDLYGRVGAEPGDIRSIEDFEALPFLTREDVREHLEEMVAPSLRDQALPNSTGGSTGHAHAVLPREGVRLVGPRAGAACARLVRGPRRRQTGAGLGREP